MPGTFPCNVNGTAAPGKRTISIFYQNVRGLNTKLETFRHNVLLHSYDIISITETWLSDSVFNAEVSDDRYQVSRRDRDFLCGKKKRGGGTMSMVSNSYSSIPLDDHAFPPSFEISISKIVISPSFSFYLIVVYFSPNPTSAMFDAFFDYFYTRPHLFSSNILILGDFNLPEVTGSAYFFSTGTRLARDLSEFLSAFHLSSHHNVVNNLGRTLDLVLSNFPFDSISVSREAGLVPEDIHHPPLLIQLRPSSTAISSPATSSVSPMIPSYDFRRMDAPSLYSAFKSADWSTVLSQSDVDSAVSAFYEIVYNILDANVPKSIRSNCSTKYPSFFPPELRHYLRKKDYHHSRRLKSPFHRTQFNKYRALSKKLLHLLTRSFESSIFKNAKTAPASLWKFFRHKRKVLRPNNGILKDDVLLTDAQTISEEFANFFKSVYDPVFSTYDIPSSNSFTQTFSLSQCTESQVLAAICKLKTTKTLGPDQIPPYILKACSESLSAPLAFIFNLSLSSSIFPTDFKTSYVTPVPKKQNCNQIENFRPISILSSFSLVFEQLIYDQIYQHVFNLISTSQHGFLKSKSTATNLLTLTEEIFAAFDCREQVDVIYLDFEKAFDKVNHDVLLSKLSRFGFHPSALSFVASYLRDRQQCVRYKQVFSPFFPVSSGVPQGSKLGPLLFLLSIDDISSVPLHSLLLLFADDLKLYRRISSLSDCAKLQEDLNAISAWAKVNRFSINIAKTHSMTFSRRRQPIDFTYFLDNSPLSRHGLVKDLGVLLDPKLDFSSHIDEIINKAYRSLGFIFRSTLRLQDVDTYKILYSAFVRSKLEYCSSIWCPDTLTTSKRIERIQERFVRLVFFRLNGFYPTFPNQISYKLLLSHIDLDPLSLRRFKHDLFFLHNLLRGTECPPAKLKKKRNTNTRT